LGKIRAGSTVSYGLSGRDTLTLSSWEEGRMWVAVQRELVRLDGTVLDRQEVEIRVPKGMTRAPGTLAAVGALLLMGVEPGEIKIE